MKKIALFVLLLMIAAGGYFATIKMWPKSEAPVETSMQSDENLNHLAGSLSPYLRAHAGNPVEWYPWGVEAIEKARSENKPIILSIGYASCYWCHVMEREVFSRDDVAEYMNANFVNIKVDREERPDLDMVYMQAALWVRNQQGWPNNLILTPDLEPFMGAGYLPVSGWQQSLASANNYWTTQNDYIRAVGKGMMAKLKFHFKTRTSKGAGELDADALAKSYYDEVAAIYDTRNGGIGAGVKDVSRSIFSFLYEYAQGDAGNMAQQTMESALMGGLYDHVGGGFHRYTTDARWKIPHFEKMLYNQAHNLSLLTMMGGHDEEIAQMIDFARREMRSDAGGFYSALDAQSPFGEDGQKGEGAYYVWTQAEINEALGEEDAARFFENYALQPLPHLEGHTYREGQILFRTGEAMPAMLDRLLDVREERPAPLRDDKIILGWNGMMIMALADAGAIDMAEQALSFLDENMQRGEGRFYRVAVGKQGYQNAFIDDYAWLARGLVALYNATENEEYLTRAYELIDIADQDFRDEGMIAYAYADGSDDFPVRIVQGFSGSHLPSGNAVMAQLFADLYEVTGDAKWQARTRELVNVFARELPKDPVSYGDLIYALMRVEGDNVPVMTVPDLEEIETQGASELETSADKVEVKAWVDHEKYTTVLRKHVVVNFVVEEGWHVNGNPASNDPEMKFLIPTTVDVQTESDSEIEIMYPEAVIIDTPLGQANMYEGEFDVHTTLASETMLSNNGMRAIVEVQACKGTEICYAPSRIVVPVE
jgi:uncharacterized protein YyaL (SSP411 family)